MSQREGFRFWVGSVVAVGVLGALSAGCLDRPVANPTPKLQSGVRLPVVNNSVDSVDILFEIDNSNSMRDNQAQLAMQFDVLISQLVSPPVDPMTMQPRYTPVRSLHVGVISSDLGTPGSVVPSCANSDSGDDGLLNPIRNGLAIRTHQPWTTAPTGIRPARCTTNLNQYPTFLTFEAGTTNAAEFREDFVCNAFLSTGGCGLEQQLEAAYRALVVRNPRAVAGNMDPNAGFVRNDAVLAIVMVSDEEDGSVRDCRYAEPGDPDGDCRAPRGDALGVFDTQSGDWASNDPNLRFYMYTPGTSQDPTWNLNRYIDPMRPNRGFTSLKPGRPNLVIFAGILGVPINLPTRMSGGTTEIDWTTLLGANPNGSEGFTGMSTEGPVSMRQANMDPACSMRVVPACRRQGSTANGCSTTDQYFAWPSRRLAEVARRFSVTYQNGTVSSICQSSYATALQQIVERIQNQLTGRCLPRALQTTPPICGTPGVGDGGACIGEGSTTPVTVNCVVRETLPAGMTAAQRCTTARGRRPAGRDAATGQEQCLVQQVPAPLNGRPAAGQEGFYYDTTIDPSAPNCRQRISFTGNAGLDNGASALIECVQNVGIAE